MKDNSITIESFGTEKIGKLKKVMLHRPEISISKINTLNKEFYLFDKVPDINKYLQEHDDYAGLLKSMDIEVFYLEDYISRSIPLMNTHPNLAYLHDTAVITKRGAILSRMKKGARHNEDQVIKEALSNIGIPLFYQFKEEDCFEGCLVLSDSLLMIANTERHSMNSIQEFIPEALKLFKEVIFIEMPQARRFMHPDMIYNRITDNLAIAYIPAFLKTFLVTGQGWKKINIRDFMAEKGVEIIEVSSNEQQKWACSLVIPRPGVIICYDISFTNATKNSLKDKGVKLVEFHPHGLLAGGGSLRCLTMQLETW